MLGGLESFRHSQVIECGFDFESFCSFSLRIWTTPRIRRNGTPDAQSGVVCFRSLYISPSHCELVPTMVTDLSNEARSGIYRVDSLVFLVRISASMHGPARPFHEIATWTQAAGGFTDMADSGEPGAWECLTIGGDGGLSPIYGSLETCAVARQLVRQHVQTLSLNCHFLQLAQHQRLESGKAKLPRIYLQHVLKIGLPAQRVTPNKNVYVFQQGQSNPCHRNEERPNKQRLDPTK